MSIPQVSSSNPLNFYNSFSTRDFSRISSKTLAVAAGLFTALTLLAFVSYLFISRTWKKGDPKGGSLGDLDSKWNLTARRVEFEAKERWGNKARTSSPLSEGPHQTEILELRNRLLVKGMPSHLHCGIKKGAALDPEIILAHRWSFPTNLDTLVELSTGKAYPANHVALDGFGPETFHPVSYILAESPLNTETVSWREDYYRMAIEYKAGLLLSVACPFQNGKLDKAQYDFLEFGEKLVAKDFIVECVGHPIRLPSPSCRYIAVLLKVTYKGEVKTLWQLLPLTPPEGSFSEIQETVELVDRFIQQFKLQVDRKHPLLVNCRTGLDRTGRFVLFHDLYRQLKITIGKVFLGEKNLNNEQIADVLLKNLNVSEMLRLRASAIECLSTKTAAIDALNQSVLPAFNGNPGCTPDEVNNIYKKHVLATIEVVLKELAASV